MPHHIFLDLIVLVIEQRADEVFGHLSVEFSPAHSYILNLKSKYFPGHPNVRYI